MVDELNTEEKIIDAARSVFAQKGLDGARMQEIAEKANINKALLHYYFRTKEKLFETIVSHVATKFFPSILSELTKNESLEEKIRIFARSYITFIQENPYLPNFILNLLNQNPEKLINIIKINDVVKKIELQQQIDEEAKKGNIRRVDAYQLLINMLSLCIFPFIGKPLLMNAMSLNEKRFNALIEERKELVPEIIICWLKTKEKTKLR